MDELSLITLAAAKSYTDEHGGGGGGTNNYNDLSNQPQINGTTLVGNKSASDLSLATTADLAGKVDKVEGYGLSENDYTDADKAIVGGVTAALADKADKSAVKNEFIGTTAEWNALTTAQKKEYDTYQLTDDYTEGKYAHHYSTDEQIVGTWIDGSTIYERTWDLGSDITLSAGQWVNMSQYITIPNCDKMIVSSGVSSEGVTSTLESAYNAGYLELRHMQFNGAVRYVTLQYTKTA